MKQLLLQMLFCAGFFGAAHSSPRPVPAASADSIVIQKNMTRKAHKVTLSPDAHQQVLFFTVRGAEGKVYQLFVFDMDGHIVKQAETRNRQTTLINGIDKGNYLFEVFSDDDRIGNGQITVK